MYGKTFLTSYYPVVHQWPNWLLSEPRGSQWAPLLNRWLTSPQCILGILGHGISLIQNHQLETLPEGQEGQTFIYERETSVVQ